MAHLPVFIYSSFTLENWDYNTPFTTGIGGSETSHVYMVRELARLGFDITSYAPVKEQTVGPEGVNWIPYTELNLSIPAVVINYRSPDLFRGVKPDGAKWWFIAQDVDYPWEEGALGNVDRYVCLCRAHAEYTLHKYPQLRGKVYVSSNGIDPERVGKLADTVRDPNLLVYTSSPDRGLMLLLENWFRLKERCPDICLNIYYGFNNMNKVIELMGGNDWRVSYKAKLESLLNQPGVTYKGRVPQQELYQVYRTANVWPYPADWFKETSCITSMEVQACGVVPVVVKTWAVGENVFAGDSVMGSTKNSALVRSLFLDRIVDNVRNTVPYAVRKAFSDDALETFAWSKFARQWAKWIEEDWGK